MGFEIRVEGFKAGASPVLSFKGAFDQNQVLHFVQAKL